MKITEDINHWGQWWWLTTATTTTDDDDDWRQQRWQMTMTDDNDDENDWGQRQWQWLRMMTTEDDDDDWGQRQRLRTMMITTEDNAGNRAWQRREDWWQRWSWPRTTATTTEANNNHDWGQRWVGTDWVRRLASTWTSLQLTAVTVRRSKLSGVYVAFQLYA